ncbi:MAG TPA: hypothetical protein VM754_03090, partial [Actinomycetota bacterium]|nr:hypothetical protein [Actinomycetota bacterium]
MRRLSRLPRAILFLAMVVGATVIPAAVAENLCPTVTAGSSAQGGAACVQEFDLQTGDNAGT